jgi:hypothetical protein
MQQVRGHGVIPACALAVLAGSGALILGGGAAPGQPAGIYHAVIHGRIGTQTITENVWYEVPGGRFRDAVVDRLGRQARERILTVFNGTSARTKLIGRAPRPVTVYHGTPAFSSAIASGLGVSILASYLQGSPQPAGTSISVSPSAAGVVLAAHGQQTSLRLTVRRDPTADASRLFALPDGRVALTDTQIQLHGQHAAGGYWIGPPGHGQAFAFVDGRGDVEVLYPDLVVDSSGTLTGGSLPGVRIQLAGHTPASLVRGGPDGTIRVSTGNTSIDVSAFGSDRFAGTAEVLVFTRTSTILLMGPALAHAGAAQLAGQLRRF